jgi:hypothetical protein
MRPIARSPAVWLSLLMFLSSVSTAACDLHCWLYQTRSDCHTVSVSTTGKDTAMPMPGMDMSSPQPMTGPGVEIRSTSDDSTGTPSDMSVGLAHSQGVMERDARTNSVRRNAKTLSSCSQELCSQISASASPPSGDRSQLRPQHWIATDISSPPNPWMRLHWVRAEAPSPEIVVVVRLTATLRI